MTSGFLRGDALAELSARLWSFFRSSASVEDVGAYVDSVWQLPMGQFERLRAVHLMLRPETAAMLAAVGELIRRLPRPLARVQEEYSGFVHGPVDWPRTQSRRISTGDPTVFVCSPPERMWDSVPARMCHYALMRAAYIGALTNMAATQATGQVLEGRTDRARLLLRNPQLSGLRGVRYPSTDSVRRATARRPALGQVDAFVELVRGFFDAPTTASVKAVLDEQLLAPAADDDLFELVVGYRIVDHLAANGFRETSLVQLREDGSKMPLARLRSPKHGRVDIWWDRSLWSSPTGTARSVMRRVLDAAAMAPGALRPDLILHFIDKGRFFPVEVKVTAGETAAERDGILEVLAYLKDGEDLFANLPEPHAMVVAWNATGKPWDPAGPPKAPVIVSDQDTLEAAVDGLLSAL